MSAHRQPTWIRRFLPAVLAAALVPAALAAEKSPEETRAVQAALDAQPRRIERDVAGLEPQRPGTVDVYFVGFAGYGGQGVFRKEIEFARDSFARRFGTGGRSVLLVNDDSDRETYPVATVGGLRHALRLVGERMDREEDVLILMITSHGTADEGAAVTNGSLELEPLRPDALRAMLDESGIEWRIVIASACYSGVFVPPLKGTKTLVLTAADARHSSFGCEDERELTYFGEALLRDALPHTPSLERAFHAAREAIRRREREEGLPHSRPQIHVGAAIRAKLAALESERPTPRSGAHR